MKQTNKQTQMNKDEFENKSMSIQYTPNDVKSEWLGKKI